MSGYRTQQKQTLMEFLGKQNGRAMSAREIAAAIRQDESVRVKPGLSTVYRLLDRLTQEGTLKRFVSEGSAQYVCQNDGGDSCHNHLHIKCLECGRLEHVSGSKTRKLMEQVRETCDFQLDEDETVLLGRCRKCAGKP